MFNRQYSAFGKMEVPSEGYFSHPSVRVKGAEDRLNLVNCVDQRCEHSQTAHFHCPFCLQSSIFSNAEAFKVHYSVLHLDRSIDFAGFKHLCCYRDCRKRGIVSKSNNFIGGHWHCFECRIILPRRQSAFLHFKLLQKSRFPLQVYIAKDVNNFAVFNDEKDGPLCRQNNLNYDPVKTQPEYEGMPVLLEGSAVSLSNDSQEDFSSEASDPAAQENNPTTTDANAEVVNALSGLYDKEEGLPVLPNGSILSYGTVEMGAEYKDGVTYCTPVVLVGNPVSLSGESQEGCSSEASEPVVQGNEPKIVTILQQYKKILPHPNNGTITTTYNNNGECAVSLFPATFTGSAQPPVGSELEVKEKPPKVTKSARNVNLLNLVKKLESEILQLTAKKVRLENKLESGFRQLKPKDSESERNLSLVNLVTDLQNEIIKLTEKNVNLELKMKTEVGNLKSKLKNQEAELENLRGQTKTKTKLLSLCKKVDSNRGIGNRTLVLQLDKLDNVKGKSFQQSTKVYSKSEPVHLPSNVTVDEKPFLRCTVGQRTTDSVSNLNNPHLPASNRLTRAVKRKCDVIGR